MEIETSMANAVLNQMHLHSGLCSPTWLVKNTFVWFALDNVDFLESTPSGKNTLNGTAIAIYQCKTPNKEPMLAPLKLDRSLKTKTLHAAAGCNMLTFKKPNPQKIEIRRKLSTHCYTLLPISIIK